MRHGLDSIFKVGFGVDFNCMDGSSSEDGAKFIKAFDAANERVTLRYMDPLWKLKRILNLGPEAAFKRNIQIMDEFVRRLIQQKHQLLLEKQHSVSKDDNGTDFNTCNVVHLNAIPFLSVIVISVSRL